MGHDFDKGRVALNLTLMMCVSSYTAARDEVQITIPMSIREQLGKTTFLTTLTPPMAKHKSRIMAQTLGMASGGYKTCTCVSHDRFAGSVPIYCSSPLALADITMALALTSALFARGSRFRVQAL